MSIKVKKSMAELKHALFASLVTILAAVVVSVFIHEFHDAFVSKNEIVEHHRSYEKLPGGGVIVYDPDDGDPDEYRNDLEILSRRFLRGEFQMVTIPGSVEAKEIRAMVANSASMSYRVDTRNGKPALFIDARGMKAVKAVHEYLQFLENRWMVTVK